MKETVINEYILEHKTKGDALFIQYDAKVVALADKCAKIHAEYLESKRGYVYPDSWYKRVIETDEKLLTMLEPYIAHGFEHLHDPVMLREKVNAETLNAKTLPPTLDIVNAYHRSLLMLIDCYTDLCEEEARTAELNELYDFAHAYAECSDKQHAMKEKMAKVKKDTQSKKATTKAKAK